MLHLKRFGEYQGLLEIPDDEGGLFQNAWFQGVLYFERLSALILLKRGDAQISMRGRSLVGLAGILIGFVP